MLDIQSLLKKNAMQLEEVEVIKIRPTPLNRLEMTRIDELVESLLLFKQLEPIRVRPICDDNYDYEIVDGQRRHTAYLKILSEYLDGWQDYVKMQCIIDTEIKSDDDLEEKLVEVALQKRELLPSEKLWLIGKKKLHYKRRANNGEKLPTSVTNLVTESVKDMGINREMVRRYSKIDETVPEIKQDFNEGKVNVLTAAKISDLSQESQLKLHEKIETGSLNKKDIDLAVQELSVEEKYGERLFKKIVYAAVKVITNKDPSITKQINGETFIEVIPKRTHLKEVACGEFILTSVSSISRREYLEIHFMVLDKKDKVSLSFSKVLDTIRELLPDEKMIEKNHEEYLINVGAADFRLVNAIITTNSVTSILVNNLLQITIFTNERNINVRMNNDQIEVKLKTPELFQVCHEMIVCQFLMGIKLKNEDELQEVVERMIERVNKKAGG